MDIVFLSFLQRIALGAAAVLALLLVGWIKMPRRSAAMVDRREKTLAGRRANLP